MPDDDPTLADLAERINVLEATVREALRKLDDGGVKWHESAFRPVPAIVFGLIAVAVLAKWGLADSGLLETLVGDLKDVQPIDVDLQ